MKRFEKGFIGAIGDDLPSLIPIVFALLIFFSAFSSTLSVYNRSNSQVVTDMGMLSVARTLKGDSLLLNYSQFEGRCNDLRIQKFPYNFMVAIYKADKQLETVVSDFSDVRIESDDVSDSKGLENFLKGETTSGDKSYFCGYLKLGSKDFGDLASGQEEREEYMLRYYPVAIQTKVTIETKEYYVIIPGVMAMVIWQ